MSARARSVATLAAAAGASAALALLAACAQPSPPPGGPPDPLPPALVRIVPESGAVNARPDEVLFRFDEVVAERPTGTPSTEGMVLISPRDGAPEVSWRRTGVGVRPARGWRENTTYVVELLPGIADLRGNRRDSSAVTIFSTGGAIPATRIEGVVFDWPRGAVASGALVQAIVRPDSARRDSIVYVTRTDSSGRFTVRYVPAGAVTLRGILDANRNLGLDPREAYDSLRFALTDSARVELYAFAHDTIGPRIANLAVQDSVSLRLTLDQPLALDQQIAPALVRLFGADSTPLAVAQVLSGRAADSLAQAAREAAAARNTTPPPPPADTARAAADSVRAAQPALRRPVPVSELVIRPAAPLAAGARYRLVLVEARGLSGATETSDRQFTTPAAAAAAPADSAAARPDSAGVRRPPR